MLKIEKIDNGNVIITETTTGQTVQGFHPFDSVQLDPSSKTNLYIFPNTGNKSPFNIFFANGVPRQINFVTSTSDTIANYTREEAYIKLLTEFFFLDNPTPAAPGMPFLGVLNVSPGPQTAFTTYFNNLTKRLYYWDDLRVNWLSFDSFTAQYGQQVPANVAAGSYFRMEGVLNSPSISGINSPFINGCIVNVTGTRQNALSTQLVFYDNAVPVSILAWPNGNPLDASTNIPFAGVLALRNQLAGSGGNNINSPNVSLIYKLIG